MKCFTGCVHVSTQGCVWKKTQARSPCLDEPQRCVSMLHENAREGCVLRHKCKKSGWMSESGLDCEGWVWERPHLWRVHVKESHHVRKLQWKGYKERSPKDSTRGVREMVHIMLHEIVAGIVHKKPHERSQNVAWKLPKAVWEKQHSVKAAWELQETPQRWSWGVR
jgi:hypothetical protein